MVQRPGDPHAVWHFWTGPDREFTCWYINLQADFVRAAIGYDTQDFELDLVVFPDGFHWSRISRSSMTELPRDVSPPISSPGSARPARS